MSDLGAIFHVTADGKQYDAHAYTTTDECPEPNLKIKFKGTAAYIKLEAKGSGDVPCYVKTKAGGVYQVLKEAIPNDTLSLKCPNRTSFTVPRGIKVIQVSSTASYSTAYIGVTPGATYELGFIRQGSFGSKFWKLLHVTGSDDDGGLVGKEWQRGYNRNQYATLAWNSRINQEKVTVSDYM